MSKGEELKFQFACALAHHPQFLILDEPTGNFDLIYMENGSILTAMDIEELRSRYRIVAGEDYRMKLLPEQRIIHMEKGEFATKALMKHRQIDEYDSSYTVSVPTIEEFMYFVTKRTRRIEL